MTGSHKSSSRPWGKHLIGLLITTLCLVVLFRQINFDDVLEALTHFHWSYLIFGVASLSFGYSMRILRWSIMLRSTGAATSFAECSAPFLGSIALNNILPLRLGDVVRALIFSRSMGYVGPFHLAAFTAVSLVGGTAGQAASYAVIVHLALWLPTTIAGVIAIWTDPELFRMAKASAA